MANTASSVGHMPAQPGIPRLAPSPATNAAVSSGTPAERSWRTVTGIVPMLLSEVKATMPAGQNIRKKRSGLRRVAAVRISGWTTNIWIAMDR